VALVRRTAALFAAALVAFAPSSRAEDCSEDDADAAEQSLGAVIDQLKAAPGKRGAWDKLGVAIRRYRSCDEDELAQLFSIAVCQQLTRGWKDAPAIALAGRRSPEVLAFLLRHLDRTCPSADLARIAENSERRCPRYGKKFCAAIRARAAEALADHPAIPADE
jgi:hypothetical protein